MLVASRFVNVTEYRGKEISRENKSESVAKHPYNMIMQGFYHRLPQREAAYSDDLRRPAILGLTASPIYGGHVDKAFG